VRVGILVGFGAATLRSQLVYGMGCSFANVTERGMEGGPG